MSKAFIWSWRWSLGAFAKRKIFNWYRQQSWEIRPYKLIQKTNDNAYNITLADRSKKMPQMSMIDWWRHELNGKFFLTGGYWWWTRYISSLVGNFIDWYGDTKRSSKGWIKRWSSYIKEWDTITQIIGVYACTQVVPCRDQADSIQVRPPASESAESKIVVGRKGATNA